MRAEERGSPDAAFFQRGQDGQDHQAGDIDQVERNGGGQLDFHRKDFTDQRRVEARRDETQPKPVDGKERQSRYRPGNCHKPAAGVS